MHKLVDGKKVEMTQEEIKLFNAPSKESDKEVESARALSALHNLDMRSIRALRAGDTEYIASLEAEAIEIRKKLK